MDEMINNAEEFYQSLGIAYRIVNIVSGVCVCVCVCCVQFKLSTVKVEGIVSGCNFGRISVHATAQCAFGCMEGMTRSSLYAISKWFLSNKEHLQ